MSRCKYIFVLFIILIPQIIFSQTISSTTSGGEWNNTSTWVGGVVPTSSNDAQINGVVEIEGDNNCRNLSIATNGVLQNRYYYYGYWRYLNISGNLINNGIIRNHPNGGDKLIINLAGNLTNNNICENTRIVFNGSKVQNVSLANNKVFKNDFEIGNSFTIPTAISNIKLTSQIDFKDNTSYWDMNNYSLTLDGNDITANPGTIKNVNDVIGLNSSIFEDLSLTGNVNFKETISARNISIDGNLTVTDTLQNPYYYYGYWQYLNISGNLTNNGVIRNHPSRGDKLIINLAGNLTNNNICENTRIVFNGSKVQNVSLANNKVFKNDFEIGNSFTIPKAISNIKLTSQIDFKDNSSYWDMNNYSLTLDGNDITANPGTIKNVSDVIGLNSSIFEDLSLTGNVNFKETISARNISIDGNLTVTDTLQNPYYYYGYWQYLNISGNLINNGVIRNHPNGGDKLIINLAGNLTNNNICENTRIVFNGSKVQNVYLASNKVFKNDFEIGNSNTIPKAISNIKLTSQIDFKDNTSYWDMNSFALTLDGNDITANPGTIKNVKDLIGLNSSIFEDLSLTGNVNFKETISVRNVSIIGNLTVTDTLQNPYYYYGYSRYLSISGNLINNGVIRNHSNGGDKLIINLAGNLTNNNICENSRIIFNGSKVQNVSLADNKVFQNSFEIYDSLSIPTAISEIKFKNQIYFRNKTSYWDMNNNSLILDGNDITENSGTIKNVKDVIGLNGSILEDLTFTGNVNFKETISIRNVSIIGNLTVTDTLQNPYYYYGYSRYLSISGNLTNNGVIRNHPSGGDKLILSVSGDIEINGTATNNAIELFGTYPRTINGNGLADNVKIRVVNPGVELIGENTISNLEVISGASCKLRSGGILTITGTSLTGSFQNNGEVTFVRTSEAGGTYNSYDMQIDIPNEHGLDTIWVTNHGFQVPSSYANAVKEYWSINSSPDNNLNSSKITFYYHDELLGSNNEDQLEIFHSTDNGQTWKQISTTLNTTRNSNLNYLTFSDAPMSGNYCLSSSPDPVSVRPSVILSIIGRNTIRVGPPNRFTIHYVNNSDVESNEMIMELGIDGEGGFIDEIIPSVPEGAPEIRIPIDSLTFDGRRDSVYLWIGSMEPHEERTFDVVISATPGLAKTASLYKPDFVITLSGVLIYAGVAVVTSYVKDVAFQLSEEIWRPVADCETVSSVLYDAVKDSFRKTNKSWFCYEKPATAIAEQTIGDAVGKLGSGAVSAVNKANLVKDAYTAISQTHKGMSRYLDDDFKVKDCSGNERKITGESSKKGRELTKVTSWDPNEKVAPSGFGTGGFITTAGRMQYQILFENKKEASAPAWKIVIIDTLSENFDPETVLFGKASHEGENYNWITKVEGNVVTWEIVDIELPPNVTPPEGEGYVSFSVMTKNNLPSGTELKNTAAITFDLNKPIITNEVVNTIDFLSPVTTLAALVDTVFGNSVTVTWNATDPENGSGISTTTVYMSDNDGGFYPVGSTDQTSLDVDILGGHKYDFYALSKDNVGNIELEKPNTVSIFVVSGVEEEEENIPKKYSLSQNYPNPFNPSTKIDFELPFESKVKIEIFNILGQTVTILENAQLNAGKYSKIWNAKNLSSGIYFIRFVATAVQNENQKFTSLKKMIFLK